MNYITHKLLLTKTILDYYDQLILMPITTEQYPKIMKLMNHYIPDYILKKFILVLYDYSFTKLNDFKYLVSRMENWLSYGQDNILHKMLNTKRVGNNRQHEMILHVLKFTNCNDPQLVYTSFFTDYFSMIINSERFDINCVYAHTGKTVFQQLQGENHMKLKKYLFNKFFSKINKDLYSEEEWKSLQELKNEN